MVRIKFKSKEDRINGFYELAIKGRGRSLPNNVFEIADQFLKILDDAKIAYKIITKEEIAIDETEAIRNSLTVEL
jgi:hypothetical protein